MPGSSESISSSGNSGSVPLVIPPAQEAGRECVVEAVAAAALERGKEALLASETISLFPVLRADGSFDTPSQVVPHRPNRVSQEDSQSLPSQPIFWEEGRTIFSVEGTPLPLDQLDQYRKGAGKASWNKAKLLFIGETHRLYDFREELKIIHKRTEFVGKQTFLAEGIDPEKADGEVVGENEDLSAYSWEKKKFFNLAIKANEIRTKFDWKCYEDSEEGIEFIRDFFSRSTQFLEMNVRNLTLIESIKRHQTLSPDKSIVILAGRNHVADEVLSNFDPQDYCAIHLLDGSLEWMIKARKEHSLSLCSHNQEALNAATLLSDAKPARDTSKLHSPDYVQIFEKYAKDEEGEVYVLEESLSFHPSSFGTRSCWLEHTTKICYNGLSTQWLGKIRDHLIELRGLFKELLDQQLDRVTREKVGNFLDNIEEKIKEATYFDPIDDIARSLSKYKKKNLCFIGTKAGAEKILHSFQSNPRMKDFQVKLVEHPGRADFFTIAVTWKWPLQPFFFKGSKEEVEKVLQVLQSDPSLKGCQMKIVKQPDRGDFYTISIEMEGRFCEGLPKEFAESFLHSLQENPEMKGYQIKLIRIPNGWWFEAIYSLSIESTARAGEAQ